VTQYAALPAWAFPSLSNQDSVIEQRTPEWFAARRGKVTASRVGDILNVLKSGGWSATRRNYAAQLVTERLSGRDPEPITNEWIEWGKEQEPFARDAYTAKTDFIVTEVGFVDHPRIPMAGASPDGLVGTDGLIEIKCPTTAVHIETFLNEEVKEQYVWQMYWQLACTQRKWCDFVSYDPRMPEDMQLFIKRFEYDEKIISKLEEDVSDFLDEVAETVQKLQDKVGGKEPSAQKEDW
jgi:putative phage-type endonuclease